MESQLDLFNCLIEADQSFGLTLIGTRALGNLRLEKGYRSWGAELTTEVTPAAAGLEPFCSKTKKYIGSSAVDAQRNVTPEKVLATLSINDSRVNCWGSEPILSKDRLIGYVTSGGFGWRIDKCLAVGLINSRDAAPGTNLQIQISGELYAAEVIADPAYDAENLKLRN